MPAHRVRTEIGEHRQALAVGELVEAKRLFGVSAQALAYRCKDLEIISHANYRQLFDSFEKLGWRSPPYDEPNPVAKESSRRFHRLCFRAFSEGLISDTKAAELLRISLFQLDRDIFLELDSDQAPQD
jgi:Zn-dependent peptidase ImmA (M78 family)